MNNKKLVFVVSVIFVSCLVLPIWSDETGTKLSVLERLLRLEKQIPPLGTIMAWHKNMPGNQPLPDGWWVECNGQTLSDPQSIFHGRAIPNLNGGKGYFLRGGTTSGVTQGESVNAAGMTVDIAHTHNVSGTVGGKDDGTHDHNIHDPGHAHELVVWNTPGHGAGFNGNSGDAPYRLMSTPASTTGITVHGVHSGHSHTFSLVSTLSTTNKNISSGDETRPINMSVVWIMRVK